MAENNLRQISGKKIRRAYCRVPLTILCFAMLAIPYFICIFASFLGKADAYPWMPTFGTSIGVCFIFSLPLLTVRALSKHFFGKIVCVLTENGIYYPTGMIRWETIDRIEYTLDAEPRYKSDNPKTHRAIIYTQGGKHIILQNAPMSIISQVKKYQNGIDARVSGVRSALSPVLIMGAILAVLPFYIILLMISPGASSMVHFGVMAVAMIVASLIRMHTFDTYAIPYRFWSRILPNKRLSYIVLGFYYTSYFTVLLALCYLPYFVVAILLGVYLGFVQPPVPRSRGGHYTRRILSYEELYDIYINRADFWEKHIENKKKQ